MKLFLISETLTTGGAEWFSLRLANALMQKGHTVYFFVMRADIVNERIVQKFPNIKIIMLPRWWIKLLANADRVIKKISGKNRLVELANARLITHYGKKVNPDALHGHLIEADLVAVRVAKKISCTTVTTVHGDYNIALQQQKRIPEITFLMNQLNHVAVISDLQQQLLSNWFPKQANKISKVYNGYPFKEALYGEPDNNTFTFGMIARGIPDKGWEPLIIAFKRLQAPHARLLIYGESDYLLQLKAVNDDARIRFMGFTNEPLRAIAKLHVGMLPSYEDSLPTSVIEYLALQKPVIATNVGEIKNMLHIESRDQYAGTVLDFINKEALIDPLYEAMYQMMTDTSYYLQAKANCHDAFAKFSMDTCIESYENLYRNEAK